MTTQPILKSLVYF